MDASETNKRVAEALGYTLEYVYPSWDDGGLNVKRWYVNLRNGKYRRLDQWSPQECYEDADNALRDFCENRRDKLPYLRRFADYPPITYEVVIWVQGKIKRGESIVSWNEAICAAILAAAEAMRGES